MVIVDNWALTNEVGYRECVTSCLLGKVVCLGIKVMVGVRTSHSEMYMIELVVCGAIGSCKWGLGVSRPQRLVFYTIAYAARLLCCKLRVPYEYV